MTQSPLWQRQTLWVVTIAIAALALRVGLSARSGLWVDEVFSLAMATGHSVEHPPATAEPGLGDFVVPAGPRPAAAFAAYGENEADAPGLDRVLRAVRRSDTNPPMYYALLWVWTLGAGESDAALRLFSTVWAVACIPLIWSVARRLHGETAAVIATTAFAISPLALYYSSEGRMYPLIWFCGLALANLTLALRDGDRHQGPIGMAWVAVAAVGLLTHYFFAFVWGACTVWLLGSSQLDRRLRMVAIPSASVLIVLPWYSLVPVTLSQWRITDGWLDGPMSAADLLLAPGRLAHGLVFSGGSPDTRYLTAAISLSLVFLALRQIRLLRPSASVVLVWGWAAACIVGLLAFDVWRGTRTSDYLRYALPALPAALILLAVVITTARPAVQAIVIVSIVGVWWHVASVSVFTSVPRPGQPLPDVARNIQAWAHTGDGAPLVIVHSIPTGLIGLARYLDGSLAVYPSVPRINNGTAPPDIHRLTTRYDRFAFVGFHDLGTESAYESWLSAHTQLVGREQIGGVRVAYFARHASAAGR